MKLLVQFFIILGLLSSFIPQQKNGNVKISFVNMVDKDPVVLGKQYINPFNETYTVSRLKYYISNIVLKNTRNKIVAEKDSYHLITEAEEDMVVNNNFSFAVKTGTYQSISFLIGVDSIKNVSGAQTNALDPLNGMFWTWNTGYIMFKMEGTSPQSTIANNTFEYHIGGFSGSNNVLRLVELPLASLQIKKGSNTEIIIEADINKLWQQGHGIKISETPVCTSMGNMAYAIADNYSKIFSTQSIANK
jgi:hypothetical protein